MAISTTNLVSAMKVLMMNEMYNDMTYMDRPLMAWLPKHTKFYGKTMDIPIKYSRSWGVGGNGQFTVAQTNAGTPQFKKFDLTRSTTYSVAQIEGEAIEATRHDIGAYIRALKDALEDAWQTCADLMEIQLFRNGDGSVAVMGTVTSTTVFATDKRCEVFNFEVGMNVGHCAAGGGAVVDDEYQIITGLNRNTGVITVGTAFSTLPVAAQEICIEGFALDAGSSYLAMRGLDAWMPAAAPDSTAFFGVDRTADSRLYGCIHDASSGSVTEGLIDAAGEAHLNGGRPKVGFINPLQSRRIKKELGDKQAYREVNIQAKGNQGLVPNISFPAFQLQSETGQAISFISANKCPAVAGFLLDERTLALNTLAEGPRFLNEDEVGKLLRIYNADAYESRVGARGNLGCNAPGHNTRMILPDPEA